MQFEPIPGINYAHDYVSLFTAIDEAKVPEIEAMRYLITNDLWFLLNFVLKIPKVNHPYVVNNCHEIESGPQDMTLDIWFRGGFKSSCITIGETIQYVLKYPEKCTGILCYTKALAEKFLFAIKETLANNVLLLKYFPDVLYPNPLRDAPIWSIEKGIVVKRDTSRPDATVAAYGLIEGMPTGVHPDRRIYDDITTWDLCQSHELMERAKEGFDMSQSLGKEDGTHRVLGTPYAYDDTLNYIENKKIFDGKPLYHIRKKPITVDGTPNGKPVFVSQEYLEYLKTLKTYFTQYLLNPAPTEVKKLHSDALKVVSPSDMPERLFKFLIIDPSGKKGTGDPCAILLIGINPDKDDNGTSNIYILNAIIEKFTLSAFIKTTIEMYCKSGKILQIGVEEVGQSTTEVHIADALNAKGYKVSADYGNIQIYKPSKRTKIKRIEELSWALNNGKIHISSTVPSRYIDIIKAEMDGFPYNNDDHAIDILSYFVIDTLPNYPFPRLYTNIVLSRPIPAGAFN